MRAVRFHCARHSRRERAGPEQHGCKPDDREADVVRRLCGTDLHEYRGRSDRRADRAARADRREGAAGARPRVQRGSARGRQGREERARSATAFR